MDRDDPKSEQCPGFKPLPGHIQLAHGNGGRWTRWLIEQVILPPLRNPALALLSDAAPLRLEDGDWYTSTDGFTVEPLAFPGGDIGTLAVHGTVNDLAMAGAEARYLTLNCFLEEGLEIACLQRILGNLARAANEAGVAVVAGDTKVLRRGQGGGVYLATTGLGRRLPGFVLSPERVVPGDCVLVSGPVGDHGAAVMLAREDFGLSGELQSDAASVWPLVAPLASIKGLKWMRDPTRGGLATVACELAQATGHDLLLEEASVPVRAAVQTVCEMLGFDPLYLACEGRVTAVVAADAAETVLRCWHQIGAGESARVIGTVQRGTSRCLLRTRLGGVRPLEPLEDDPLPRIC